MSSNKKQGPPHTTFAPWCYCKTHIYFHLICSSSILFIKIIKLANKIPNHLYWMSRYDINWNYGLLPQTWEDPSFANSEVGGAFGDNDPGLSVIPLVYSFELWPSQYNCSFFHLFKFSRCCGDWWKTGKDWQHPQGQATSSFSYDSWGWARLENCCNFTEWSKSLTPQWRWWCWKTLPGNFLILWCICWFLCIFYMLYSAGKCC